MERYLVLLRGINVGGHNVIKMEVLKEIFESMELKNVKTFIQSGNVVFDSKIKDRKKIIKQIETKLKEKLGNDVTAIIRAKEEMDKIIKLDPFKAKYKDEDVKLYVCFLADTTSIKVKLPFISPKKDMEVILFKDTEAYVVSRKLTHMYGFPNNFIEAEMKTTATTRNWNSVVKLYNIMSE